MSLRLSLTSLALFFAFTTNAQHDSIKSRVSHNEFIKINYENDYFTGTDIYYTQGIKLECSFPCLKYAPLMFMLPRFSNSVVQYGVFAEQDCFTPTSISVGAIQYGDRPYAGNIYVGETKTSVQEDKQQKLTSEVDVGEIGACAECGEEQSMIHRWINDRQPDGWKYQIGTQVSFNYRMRYEKGVVRDSALDISGYGEFNAGNIYDNVILGGKLRLGKMQFYFASDRTRKFQLYTFLDGWAEGVGYNGTLQGALFSNNSIYTLTRSEVFPALFGYSYGICLSYKSILLEYYSEYISYEIVGGRFHAWGHIGIGGYF